MRPPVAIVISNYNMPEAVDRLVADFARITRWPYDLVVADNGSDKVPPSRHTALSWRENLGPAAVWRIATTWAERLAHKRGAPHLGYLLCCTSTLIPPEQGERDLVAALAEALLADPNAVFVHPAHVRGSGCSYPHLFDAGSGGLRRVGFAEAMCGLVRADWWHAVGGFDPAFQLNWGCDIDLCMQARLQGRGVWLHEGALVGKEDSLGYHSGRYEMSAEERRTRATAEMNAIFKRKYGKSAARLVQEMEAAAAADVAVRA
jgi:hypothetical protein